jgi:hypothetical protein
MFVINEFRWKGGWPTRRWACSAGLFSRKDPSEWTTGQDAPLSSNPRFRKMPKSNIRADSEDQYRSEREKHCRARLVMGHRYEVPSHFSVTRGRQMLGKEVQGYGKHDENAKKGCYGERAESHAHASKYYGKHPALHTKSGLREPAQNVGELRTLYCWNT